MSDKDNVVVGETIKGKAGLQFDCPFCGEVGVSWPGLTSCALCGVEFTIVEPEESDELVEP